MIVEGVNFVEHEIAKLSKNDFLEQSMPVFFQDREPERRKKILEDIYNRISMKHKQ